ncbi:uncharacterized protein LOC126893608 isoform X2 [Daktulosphaira vitifoliae]|uniref:uncharacterized protein LOC126893608 isoform X2 n=1 Tax=Daktulosphaira vitifoliae TaxID=58002 RepID=UPI0021AA357E|nr:uncharacterized protein LOC126893608 isoform X2 [Daktulosphaira vitifoliae]
MFQYSIFLLECIVLSIFLGVVKVLQVNNTQSTMSIEDNFVLQVKSPDDVCKVCAFDPPTVSFVGCKHHICNYCANLLRLFNCHFCPICEVPFIELIEPLKLCECNKEIATCTRILFKGNCPHRIGHGCALRRLPKRQFNHCDECGADVKAYTDILPVDEYEKRTSKDQPIRSRLQNAIRIRPN